MAHLSIGTIGSFQPSTEDWKAYTERLQLFFVANGIDDADIRRATLLTVCGPSTYGLVRDLLAPAAPTEKTFEELVALVQEHQQPTPSPIVERYTFFTRVQHSGETINDYVAQLRKIAKHCQFGETLNDMLRDRIVCGCRDKKLQYKLLADPALTFDSALAVAKASELADRGTRNLSGQDASVNRLLDNRRRKPPLPREKPPSIGPTQPCFRCGAAHPATTCKFRTSTCHYCKKQGHISKVCRKRTRDSKADKTASRSTNQLTGSNDDDEEDTDEYSLFYSSAGRTQPITVPVTLNGLDTTMEIDTGAALSVMNEHTYRSLWPKRKPPLKPTSIRLKTYTGEHIVVKGIIRVHVLYQAQQAELDLLVVAGKGPSLLGRDWLENLRLDWQSIKYSTTVADDLQEILDKHSTVFGKDLGHIKDAPATIHIDPAHKPRFCKARPVPYSRRSKVEKEISRLEEQGVIEPVQFSDWAAPVVPVVKKDGSIRLCGDYKVTVNTVAKPDTYPLPRIEDIFASLANGKSFTKLDLAHAYQQISLTEESKVLTTVNTHKGLFRYNRLPFGVSAAPSIFQRTMESLMQGLPHVVVYIDDILVTGSTEEEHLRTLEEVLDRLEKAGARLKREKCRFMLSMVEYLGHRISADGLQPTDAKIKALKQAPIPRNVTQLKAFLGLLNYYGKFVPNLSTLLAPLHKLLRKATAWIWGPDQQKAFDQAKQTLTSDRVLAHYDPSLPLILACDASPYGVGAVLSHRFPDGTEKPVAFISRSLGPAEKKYSQLDKEGLAIIFGVKRLHQYLVGRQFTILSDHKPLQHLFKENAGVPVLASARLQRWALILGAYSYTIEYKPGPDHANADVFSRLPLPECATKVPTPGENILAISMLESLPVTAREITSWTEKDPVLSRVRRMLASGWRDNTDAELKPYQQRHTQLSLHDGCVMWGSRVVIPPPGRERILEELHEGHPGISKMKSLARCFVWWPGMDKALEEKVKLCDACQRTRKLPPVAPIQPWEWPERPWARLHIDYAGPLLGHMFLVVVDAHSKWMEVKAVRHATTATTLTELRSIFATHGIPELLVSDNGSVFTSVEFKDFVKTQGIRHTTSAPYHPATNGLAERAVQTFKAYMKKAPNAPLRDNLSQFLFQYRMTPHSTTGISPSELLLNRRPRSKLDLAIPNLTQKVRAKQLKQKIGHDQHAVARKFDVGDKVYVCDLPSKKDWVPGTIESTAGPLSFNVTLMTGQTFRRHADHLRPRSTVEQQPLTDWTDIPELDHDTETPDLNSEQSPPPPAGSTLATPSVRRSARATTAPDYLVDHY
ncbi:uncharacterized protein K02A2.6-like [Halichondria panicea]|uniref:uncharacterized protein K02A2.6-like n=1 Tax=Halichondria panicea TaxID=6063 RepID=UPI00312B74DA